MTNLFSDSVLVMRRRGVWEAADAGVLLWKNSFVYFIPFFALPFWICACGLRFLPTDFHYLSYLILWWLKPFFDRLVLHVVSFRFFASPASARFTDLRRGVFRNLFKGLLGDLLWRRFSPYRSARMPIRVLERAGSKQFGRRKKTLTPGGLDFCLFLSIFGLVLEGILLFGEVMFVVTAAQTFLPTAFSYVRDNLGAVEIFIFAAFCFNFLLVESLYVCMGFGLYINSRVEVEGWDLQLLFQKFAAADKPGSPDKKKPVSGAGALLFLCLFLFTSRGIRADSGEAGLPPQEEKAESAEYFPEGFPVPDDESLSGLEAILASPDFGSEKEGWSIRFKNFDEERKMPDMDFSPWFEKIRRAFGFILRFLLILAIVAFAGFAFYWLRKHRMKGRFRLSGGGKFFVNPLLSPESPESLFAGAEDFFYRGMIREAWAACLSGCLGACEKYRSLSFPEDATEYGCLEQVRSALPLEAPGFAELVRNWVLFAYGGRTPGKGDFERSLAYGRTLLEAPREASPESAEHSCGGADEP